LAASPAPSYSCIVSINVVDQLLDVGRADVGGSYGLGLLAQHRMTEPRDLRIAITS